ncbi:unnamed protein product [Protopolystoma xenopodis]|uniref:Uncharacterized protein n=1 Tax=Protopolystoma xenopodis TaxID=117903 RepID=A0A3S5C8E3_9PLAT|nr:unnamed protein product [Protopolystoma xenopodis]
MPAERSTTRTGALVISFATGSGRIEKCVGMTMPPFVDQPRRVGFVVSFALFLCMDVPGQGESLRDGARPSQSCSEVGQLVRRSRGPSPVVTGRPTGGLDTLDPVSVPVSGAQPVRPLVQVLADLIETAVGVEPGLRAGWSVGRLTVALQYASSGWPEGSSPTRG